MRDKNSNKTVLITGATGGIGNCIALRFAEEGWNILAHYHSSEKKAGMLKTAVERLGVGCELLKADLMSKKELSAFVKRCSKYRIDSLINNAGTYVAAKHFDLLSVDDMTSTFMINVFAPILLSGKIYTGMKTRGFGRIVNISSIAAKYGGGSYSMHYGCSKMALEGLTKTLAKEGAAYNVLVNTVRPGVIDTEFHKKFPKDLTKRIAMIPMKRMGLPEDVASIVYYLGSGENSYITNEVIAVAGGE